MSKFKKGQSGNPGGRPKGSLNKATIAVSALLDGEAEKITRQVIEMALNGNIDACRLVLEFISPKRKLQLIELVESEVS